MDTRLRSGLTIFMMFGVNGDGELVNPFDAQYERQWIYHLQRYSDGFVDGSTDRWLDSGEGISFAYWSLNPNSGDTGGILCDDWQTEQTYKLELIRMMMANMALPLVLGLPVLAWQDIDQNSQIILNKDGVDYSITISDLNNKMNDMTLAVGQVLKIDEASDPNTLYAGQSWVFIPNSETTEVINGQSVVLKAWYRIS